MRDVGTVRIVSGRLRPAQAEGQEGRGEIPANLPRQEPCQSRLMKGCASEVGWNAGASPARRVRLFTTEHDLNSVAARRGWKLRKMNRRAVMKMNHI